MATTPEGKVKEAVRKLLDQYQIYYFFPATHGYGRSGVPDIVGCCNGFFFAIECKAAGGKTTALQQEELGNISAHGGTTFVINETNLSELEGWLLLHALQKSVPAVKKKSSRRISLAE